MGACYRPCYGLSFLTQAEGTETSPLLCQLLEPLQWQVPVLPGAGCTEGATRREQWEFWHGQQRAWGLLQQLPKATQCRPRAPTPQLRAGCARSSRPACHSSSRRVRFPLLLGGISGCFLAMQSHLRGRPRPWGGRRHRLRAGMPRAAWLHARVCVCAHECTHACPHGAGQSGAFWRPVSKEVAAKIPIPAFSSAKVGTGGW